MKQFILLVITLLMSTSSIAQDSIPKHLIGKIKFPVFDYHPYVGVIDVEFDQLKYDPEVDYKVAIDVYEKLQDSSKVLSAFREVGRTYNLNIANGVPQDKLKMAVVIHGYAVDAILSHEKYKEKYGIENPNLEILDSYAKQGITMYVCGQNIGMFNLTDEDISEAVGIAISAKTTLIYLDQKGYSALDVNMDE